MARNVQIELGDVIPSAQQQIIKDLKKEDMAQTELTISVRDSVNELIERGFEFYWGEDGYNYDLEVGNEYDFPAGMYSFDAPLDEYDQITKWVYVGAGKIVVSNEKNADGSWALKTILDGDGLGTDTVAAHNILASSIDTDHLATDVLTASNIQMSGGETLQNYINKASETHRDILPPSTAKKDDVWIKPKTEVKDLRDINMHELQRFGVTVSELLGGGVYVATGDVSSSSFNHWVNIASDETFARGGITNIENGLIEVVKYGDLATAGRTVIDGNNIKTGRINSVSGTYIDLDTGTFNLGAGKINYDGVSLEVTGSIKADSGLARAWMREGQYMLWYDDHEVMNLTTGLYDATTGYLVLGEYPSKFQMTKSPAPYHIGPAFYEYDYSTRTHTLNTLSSDTNNMFESDTKLVLNKHNFEVNISDSTNLVLNKSNFMVNTDNTLIYRHLLGNTNALFIENVAGKSGIAFGDNGKVYIGRGGGWTEI